MKDISTPPLRRNDYMTPVDFDFGAIKQATTKDNTITVGGTRIIRNGVLYQGGESPSVTGTPFGVRETGPICQMGNGAGGSPGGGSSGPHGDADDQENEDNLKKRQLL